MILALLLSGQGGQHPGMFDLTAELPEAQPVFAAAATRLGCDPRDLARAGKGLHGNRTGQLLCVTAALVGWALVGAAVPERTVVAGYSVGDLAAWGVAGRMAPETVLDLALARARAMDAAMKGAMEEADPAQGLAGIRGLKLPRLEAMARERGVHLAIRNGVDSFVFGGARAALEALCRDAGAAGAARAVTLDVAVPSHTPLLAAATEAFGSVLAAAPLLRPPPGAPRLLSGLDGATVFRAGAGLDKLARQVSETLDWAACLEACAEFGTTRMLELGPGHALTRMAEGVLDGARIRALEDFATPAGVRAWLRG